VTVHPTLPPEVPFSEIEKVIIDESPVGLWPENQNSNFGVLRKIISDRIQETADDSNELYNESFVGTASAHLSRWESQYGIPFNTGKTVEQRRAEVLGRVRKSPFTRSRVESLIEAYLQATFGSSPQLTPEGIPMSPGGVPLFADFAEVKTLYRVYWWPEDFSYQVWIVNTATPQAGLLRELQRITPGGITITLDNTQSQILDIVRTLRSDGPTAWWRLGADYLDFTVQSNDGIVQGAPAAIASPGLLNASIQQVDAARDFTPPNDFVLIPDAAPLNPKAYSLFAVARPDVLPSSGNFMAIYGQGNSNNFIGIGNYSGVVNWVFRVGDTTTFVDARGTSVPVAGTTYRVHGTYDGQVARLYVNGILEAEISFEGELVTTGQKAIARLGVTNSHHWNGGLDEIVHYGYALNLTQIQRHSKTVINVL
jgi:hypothetical protein